jgi:hypothetical protein
VNKAHILSDDDWAEGQFYYSGTIMAIGTGSGTIEDEENVVDRLHNVVEEITGKRPDKIVRRIGFY